MPKNRIASLSPITHERTANPRRKWKWSALAAGCLLLLSVGVFAKNGWFPSTDAFTGKKTGWFGKPLPKNAASSWNPISAPLPTPTPQLSKEYVYAGSRLLAVADANAQEAPPADLAVWRPSSGGWWVLGGPGSQQVTQNWGTTGDDPVEGDYDGDGKTDFSVFRPLTNTWYLIYSSTSTTAQFTFGASDDVPAPADFDGDGKTDPALYRPDTGVWYISQSSNAQIITPQFGNSTDVIAPADYDGDGRADIAVWRSSNQAFYSINSSNALTQIVGLGQAGAPVSADYDGDGKADHAVFNSSTGNWHIRHSSTPTLLSTIPWGSSIDIPVQNDYDADGKCDIAVWRTQNTPGYSDVGSWYILQSASGNSVRQVQWGVIGDIPVPALYRR